MKLVKYITKYITKYKMKLIKYITKSKIRLPLIRLPLIILFVMYYKHGIITFYESLVWLVELFENKDKLPIDTSKLITIKENHDKIISAKYDKL